MSDMNLKTFRDRFQNGDFDAADVHTQCDAGWYDWFCRDNSLANKTKVLGKKVLQIMNSDKVDIDNDYVFFKNNCPFHGPLYDDFRICDMKSGDVKYTIVPRSGHTSDAEVWGRDNDFDGPIISGRWKDVRAFFGV